jgi:hypothetical protein
VVVDRESWEPHQVIVKETARFNGHLLAVAAGLMTEELVVPVSAVARVSRDRIDLSSTAAQARKLPPYLTYGWAPLTRTQAAEDDLAILLGAAELPRDVETAHKATGDIEIRPGEHVKLGLEGPVFGEVSDLLVDDGELAGIVVRRKGGDVVVQVRFLQRSEDGDLFVHLTPEDLEHLPLFEPTER